jgi:hypothetical protein
MNLPQLGARAVPRCVQYGTPTTDEVIPNISSFADVFYSIACASNRAYASHASLS